MMYFIKFIYFIKFYEIRYILLNLYFGNKNSSMYIYYAICTYIYIYILLGFLFLILH